MSDLPTFVFEGGTIRTTLDLRAYRLAAVRKAAYRLAERCTAVIGTPEGDKLPVAFMFKPGTVENTAMEAARAFFQELLDQELREHVAEETGPIRTLILAQAFSRTDLIRRE
jgi:His-Xaa-Ser system protein HxsD